MSVLQNLIFFFLGGGGKEEKLICSETKLLTSSFVTVYFLSDKIEMQIKKAVLNSLEIIQLLGAQKC